MIYNSTLALSIPLILLEVRVLDTQLLYREEVLRLGSLLSFTRARRHDRRWLFSPNNFLDILLTASF